MSYDQLVTSVTNLAVQSTALKEAAQNVQVASEASRDSAEAFAIDALSAVTEAQTAVLQAPVDAAAAAEAVLAGKANTVDLVDPTDPTKGAAIFGRGVVTIASIKDLATVPRRTDLTVIAKTYHMDVNNGGGGRLHYDPLMPKSSHNGGTVFSPTVPWNGTKATHSAYLLKSGETDVAGLGCWVRRSSPYYLLTQFGALADWDTVAKDGFDNRYVLEACIKAVDHTVIPKSGNGYGVGRTGSVFIQGYTGKRISGTAELHKMGTKGIFSFNACVDVKIGALVLDGQIVRDEADAGSIWGNGRAAADFAFAVSFANCHDCEVVGATVYDFAWDGLRATGTVPSGGLTATQSLNINFNRCTLKNIRGSQIWIKGIKGGQLCHNKQSNDLTFAQKANGIYVVEWCEDIEVAHNRQFFIGDNGIGVGEPDNNAVAARNKRINVHDNLINTTRYHALLCAQAEDSKFHSNTIYRAGAKSEMIGTSNAVLCGGITSLGGGSAPSNQRNKFYDNHIFDSYEHGLYAYDRPGTSLANASADLEFYNNTVIGFGNLPTTTRLASSGITTQLQIAPIVRNNVTTDGTGDGVRIFGDVDLSGHRARRIVGSGINIPTDTLLGNTRLSAAIVDCVTSDTTGSGIVIWSKDRLQLRGCKALRGGRGGTLPTAEDTANALRYAGIALRSIKVASLMGCSGLECGSSGLVTQFCPVVKDTDGEWSFNGQTFVTSNNLRSGIYAEGDATTATKLTLINPVMDGGTTQYYPVRALYGHADGVALDPEFVNHVSVSIGITTKKLISI